MKTLHDYISEAEYANNNPVVGDYFDIVIKELFCIETEVVGMFNDGIIIEADEQAFAMLMTNDLLESTESSYAEANKIVPDIEEAEYQGRKVSLGKPMKGDVKKSKVYVKNPKTGKVVKVNFGDKNMRIKKSIPGRRKNFRARHNCANPGPRTKARYWSCRAW
jgi:hypothetical protein